MRIMSNKVCVDNEMQAVCAVLGAHEGACCGKEVMSTGGTNSDDDNGFMLSRVYRSS